MQEDWKAKRKTSASSSANQFADLADFKEEVQEELVGIREEIEAFRIDMKQEMKKMRIEIVKALKEVVREVSNQNDIAQEKLEWLKGQRDVERDSMEDEDIRMMEGKSSVEL